MKVSHGLLGKGIPVMEERFPVATIIIYVHSWDTFERRVHEQQALKKLVGILNNGY
jgi:hypothetical protein